MPKNSHYCRAFTGPGALAHKAGVLCAAVVETPRVYWKPFTRRIPLTLRVECVNH